VHCVIAAGYEYTGQEIMYSGIYGIPMEVSIFMGIVYYQRLRHMVSDKDQVMILVSSFSLLLSSDLFYIREDNMIIWGYT